MYTTYCPMVIHSCANYVVSPLSFLNSPFCDVTRDHFIYILLIMLNISKLTRFNVYIWIKVWENLIKCIYEPNYHLLSIHCTNKNQMGNVVKKKTRVKKSLFMSHVSTSHLHPSIRYLIHRGCIAPLPLSFFSLYYFTKIYFFLFVTTLK